MNRISVIICTWNRAELLLKTLQSLCRQTGIATSEVEVVVVDNNSTDNTRRVVEGEIKQWPLGRLVYEFEPRQGKQFALNRGVSAATNPVLAFTDDDIIFDSDWLAQVQALFAEEHVELAGGKTLIAWGLSGPPVWFSDGMQAVLGGVDLGDLRLDPGPPGYAPGGANLLARRALFDRVGAFSEGHYRHMDFEFGLRCQSLGVRVVYDPRPTVYAPVDERCLTLRYFRRWSFKAGIGRSGGIEAAGKGAPRVPLWVYRQLVEDWAATFHRRNAALTPHHFSRELRMWRCWGTVANAWHAWLRPGTHAEWVKSKSQKTVDLY
ncbi:MAG: glycosyltransferase family 2 protein [Burkholderiaceae bacterium]|nr:glycosyltransferase family 2 protein [Burkholderiaceae bacterium]